MKSFQVVKTIAVATALVVGAASASAQTWTAESGTGKLAFGSILSIFKSAGITVTADAPAATYGNFSNTKVPNAGVTVVADPATMTLAPNNSVLGASFLGSVNLTISDDSDYNAGTDPYTVSLKNLSFSTSDGATKGYLYADFVGNGVDTKHTLLGTAETLTPSPAVVTSPTLTVSGPTLILSTEAKNVLGKGLNLNPTGLGVLAAVDSLGSFAVTGQFAPAAAVPEPSTYALLGLGLAGLAVASRRNRKATTAA